MSPRSTTSSSRSTASSRTTSNTGSRAADNTDNTDQTETFTTHRTTTTTRILTVTAAWVAVSLSAGCAAAPVASLPAGAAPPTSSPAAPKASAAVTRLRADLTLVFTAPIMARGVWGVDIRSLDTGEPLFELNAGRLMMPASNMKIVTLAAAADALGWDYVFTTTLETSAPVEGRRPDGRPDRARRRRSDHQLARPARRGRPRRMGRRRCDRRAFRRSTAGSSATTSVSTTRASGRGGPGTICSLVTPHRLARCSSTRISRR